MKFHLHDKSFVMSFKLAKNEITLPVEDLLVQISV